MARKARSSAADPYRRIRLAGAALLLVLAGLIWLQAPWTERFQAGWFDAHQVLAPRPVGRLPVTVVEIDQKSLQALGQWPWPRTQLARLVDIVNQAEPAAIGLDILMPEADALSPERLLARMQVKDAAIVAALRSMPSNDSELARALHDAPSVMAIAGVAEVTGMSLRAVPIAVRASPPAGGATPAWTRYTGALTSLDALNSQAHGWGLISVDPSRGVVRRIPLVASVNGTLVPALALEMLRVAMRAPSLHLALSGAAVRSMSVGELTVPTEADGAVRVYFSGHRDDRFVSAVDVLEGRIDPAQLRKQLVLIGPTALGLYDYQATPTGERLSGSEIHAQLLENLVDGTLLT